VQLGGKLDDVRPQAGEVEVDGVRARERVGLLDGRAQRAVAGAVVALAVSDIASPVSPTLLTVNGPAERTTGEASQTAKASAGRKREARANLNCFMGLLS
jgi:hypothetical protein